MTRWPDQQSAVVTGASSGIGRAVAVALAEAGVDSLLVHYRSNRQGAEETAKLVEQRGCQATVAAADLRHADQREQLVEVAFERLGEITVWVNNAGADVLTGESASLDFDAKFRLLMDVDVLGTIALSRCLVPDCLIRMRRPPPRSSSWDGIRRPKEWRGRRDRCSARSKPP